MLPRGYHLDYRVSHDNAHAPSGMNRKGEMTEPTIVQIDRLGIDRPLDDGKFDFVKLFAFDAYSLRQPQFGIFEQLVLCFVSTSHRYLANAG